MFLYDLRFYCKVKNNRCHMIFSHKSTAKMWFSAVTISRDVVNERQGNFFPFINQNAHKIFKCVIETLLIMKMVIKKKQYYFNHQSLQTCQQSDISIQSKNQKIHAHSITCTLAYHNECITNSELFSNVCILSTKFSINDIQNCLKFTSRMVELCTI